MNKKKARGKKFIVGYIVEHDEDGVAGLDLGYRDCKSETLWMGPRYVSLFHTRRQAHSAIRRTIRERERWLKTLEHTTPQSLENDRFTKKWNYYVRAVSNA